MKIQIEAQNIEVPLNSGVNLRGRVRRTMSHVGEHVAKLHLSFKDANGAKGGRDKLCTVRAVLVKGGEVVVVDRADKVREALFRALLRTRSVVGREIRRRRQRERQHQVKTARFAQAAGDPLWG